MSQFPASPIFSLQIDPLPADSSILANNPILMMFDVVSLLAKNVHMHACTCTLGSTRYLIRAK